MIDFVATGDTHPTSVEFRLVSGSREVTLGDATPTQYGWLRKWNTTGSSNGTYQIKIILHNDRGITESTPVTVVVDNR